MSSPPPPFSTMDYDTYRHYVRIELSLHILMKISGVISCIASFLLARHIMKKKKWADISLTNVMLLGISVMDIIGSFFGYFMGSWMIGEYTGFIRSGPLFAGNQQTCTAQGFLVNFAFTYFVTAYAGLGALYLLMVRRGWTKTDLKTSKIRAAFLLPPIITSLAVAVPPLFYQMYNPVVFMCSLNQYPNNCENEEEVPCTRGINSLIAQRIILLYCLACNLIIIMFMILLIYGVYSQEKKIDRYLTKGQMKNRDNTTNTAWQGVRYAAAMTIPFTPAYVFLVYNLKGDMSVGSFVFWMYMTAILTPLLGLNNSCVYFYPRYKTYRKGNQDKTFFRCVCDTLDIVPWRRPSWTSEPSSDGNLSEPLVVDSAGENGNSHVV